MLIIARCQYGMYSMYVKQVSGVCTITTGKTKGKVKRWGAIKFPIKLKIQSEMLLYASRRPPSLSSKQAQAIGKRARSLLTSLFHFFLALRGSSWRLRSANVKIHAFRQWFVWEACLMHSVFWWGLMSVFWETENNLVAMYDDNVRTKHDSPALVQWKFDQLFWKMTAATATTATSTTTTQTVAAAWRSHF